MKHLILKDDDIVGILETDDVKDLKPLNDRVLIKVCHLILELEHVLMIGVNYCSGEINIRYIKVLILKSNVISRSG